MSSSDCCFLTCIQISQEEGQVVWYSHLFQNFPQFIVIHIVEGFGVVNKAEIDVFLELSCFLIIQQMLAVWSLVPLPFLKPAWTSGSSRLTYCWSLAWRILSITLLVCAHRAEELKSLSSVRLFATPWTVAPQAPWSMGLSGHEYWSGLPFPSPGDLPDLGTEPGSPAL